MSWRKRNSTLCLSNRAKKWKYSTFHFPEWESNLQLPRLESQVCAPRCGLLFIIIIIEPSHYFLNKVRPNLCPYLSRHFPNTKHSSLKRFKYGDTSLHLVFTLEFPTSQRSWKITHFPLRNCFSLHLLTAKDLNWKYFLIVNFDLVFNAGFNIYLRWKIFL